MVRIQIMGLGITLSRQNQFDSHHVDSGWLMKKVGTRQCEIKGGISGMDSLIYGNVQFHRLTEQLRIDGGLPAVAALMPINIGPVFTILGRHGSFAAAPVLLGADTLDLADVFGIQRNSAAVGAIIGRRILG